MSGRHQLPPHVGQSNGACRRQGTAAPVGLLSGQGGVPLVVDGRGSGAVAVVSAAGSGRDSKSAVAFRERARRFRAEVARGGWGLLLGAARWGASIRTQPESAR